MNKEFLKECLRVEVIGGKDKKFSWGRTLRHAWRQPKRRFLFWWRVASYLFETKGKKGKRLATLINRRLIHKYNTEIGLGAKIMPGLCVAHHNGIVISCYCEIGTNFLIRQNTTIGIKVFGKKDNEYKISIGNNVSIGANSCIISDNIIIGNNVDIGAMSFINKDIPDNSVCYTKKESHFVIRAA